MPFAGFPPELLPFLIDLKFINTPDNLSGNKAKYEKLISQPLAHLHAELAETVLSLYQGLDTKPTRCISSPYTDRRFSPKTPLKEYLYLRFKALKRTKDIPGLYFDLGCEYYSFGLRIYKQTADGTHLLHDRMMQYSGRWESALSKVIKQGFTVIGSSYKKDHYPSLPDTLTKDLMNRRSFYIARKEPVSDIVFSPQLAVQLKEGFSLLQPILVLLLE